MNMRIIFTGLAILAVGLIFAWAINEDYESDTFLALMLMAPIALFLAFEPVYLALVNYWPVFALTASFVTVWYCTTDAEDPDDTEEDDKDM